MNTQHHKSGRRRGPRRRRPNQDGPHNPQGFQSQQSQQRPREDAPKPTLFQKILAFFGFGPKKKSYPPYPGASRPESPQSGARAASSESRSEQSAPKRPARKPEATEVTSPKIYVGNLSFDASESDLFDLFNGVGSVRNAEIVTSRETEKSKGFGFVTMSSIEEATRAVTELHDKEFMGRRLVVSGAKTTERIAA
jgi:hypothetical protein